MPATDNYFAFPRFEGKRYFDEKQFREIEVLFEQIFPGDHANGIPGATDAQAAVFLTQLLALDETAYYKIPAWREQYAGALSSLDEVAKQKYHTPLAELNDADAKDLLEQLQHGQLGDMFTSFNQRLFFIQLREHCLQGCFADPRWGGNKDGIMWKWLGWIEPATDISFS